MMIGGDEEEADRYIWRRTVARCCFVVFSLKRARERRQAAAAARRARRARGRRQAVTFEFCFGMRELLLLAC